MEVTLSRAIYAAIREAGDGVPEKPIQSFVDLNTELVDIVAKKPIVFLIDVVSRNTEYNREVLNLILTHLGRGRRKVLIENLAIIATSGIAESTALQDTLYDHSVYENRIPHFTIDETQQFLGNYFVGSVVRDFAAGVHELFGGQPYLTHYACTELRMGYSVEDVETAAVTL
ncbi:MAG: hypothetical protein AAB870_00710, partial [Patescibacteria group bacterium]